MTTAGGPGTAGRGFRIPTKEGRHRAPPDPPPPDRWTAPIGAAAVLLTGLSLIAIVAPGFGYDATAVERGATVPTASRATRTVQIPLTVLPPVPTAMSTATPSAPPGASQTWAGVSVVAEATVTTPTTSTEVTQAIPTTDRPPATLPADAATENTTDSTTEPSSPASTFEAAATDSSAPTSTEETPVSTEPTESAEPTDVVGDVTDVITETTQEAS